MMRMWLRVAWTIVGFVFASFVIFNVFHLISWYTSYPVSSTFQIKRVPSIQVPNVMLCPLQPLNSSYISSTKDPLTNTLAYILASMVPHTTFQHHVTEVIKTWNHSHLALEQALYDQFLSDKWDSNPLTAYASLGWHCDKFVTKCQSSGEIAVDCCNFTSIMPSYYGPCLYFDFDKASKLSQGVQGKNVSRKMKRGGPFRITNPGLPNGISIYLNFSEITWGKGDAGLSGRGFLVNKWRYFPTNDFAVKPEESREVAYEVKDRTFLSFHSKKEKFYQHIRQPNNYVPTLSKDGDCYATCSMFHILKKCKCGLAFSGLIWPYWKSPPDPKNDEDDDEDAARRKAQNARFIAASNYSDLVDNHTLKYDLCSLYKIQTCVKRELEIFDSETSYLSELDDETEVKWNMQDCQLECRSTDKRLEIQYNILADNSYPMPPQGAEDEEMPDKIGKITIYTQSMEIWKIEEFFAFPFSTFLWYIGLTIVLYVVLFVLLFYIVAYCQKVAHCGTIREVANEVKSRRQSEVAPAPEQQPAYNPGDHDDQN